MAMFVVQSKNIKEALKWCNQWCMDNGFSESPELLWMPITNVVMAEYSADFDTSDYIIIYNSDMAAQFKLMGF